MKHIKLNGVHPPRGLDSPYTDNHYYTVTLGNRTTLMFNSQRAALAFQAETDRWISAHLHDCNFPLIDCLAAYRIA